MLNNSQIHKWEKKNCYNKIKFQTPVNSKANSNQNKLNNDKDKQGTLEPWKWQKQKYIYGWWKIDMYLKMVQSLCGRIWEDLESWLSSYIMGLGHHKRPPHAKIKIKIKKSLAKSANCLLAVKVGYLHNKGAA